MINTPSLSAVYAIDVMLEIMLANRIASLRRGLVNVNEDGNQVHVALMCLIAHRIGKT